MTKTALNTAQPEYWQLAANWSPTGIPAVTDAVVVPAGIVIQTQASDALAGTLGNDTGGNARTASTTISGSVTLNELAGETDFTGSTVTINSGGDLLVNDPTTYISDHVGGSIVVNGTLNPRHDQHNRLARRHDGLPQLSGRTDDPCRAHDPQLQSDDVPLQRRLGHESPGLPCTWSIRQYADISPNPVAVVSIEAWTNVSIAGNLGGIIVLTADATGAYADPTLPPFALIYRNGSLWNGVIDITRKGAGEYSFDMCFADGIWQLGDHGQINVYWTPDGSTWYCRSYFWLVTGWSTRPTSG